MIITRSIVLAAAVLFGASTTGLVHTDHHEPHEPHHRRRAAVTRLHAVAVAA
jgi:hypothetical protein